MGTHVQIMAQTHARTHNSEKSLFLFTKTWQKCFTWWNHLKSWALFFFFHVIIQITWTPINILVSGMSIQVFEHVQSPPLRFAQRIEQSGCKTETERASKGRERKKVQESATLTIKYAMGEEKQHQQLPRIGKVSPSKSETKCLLFIVEMDVICAQNISICARVWAEVCVCVWVCVLKLEILSARGLNDDKKRIICFLYRWMSRYWCALGFSVCTDEHNVLIEASSLTSVDVVVDSPSFSFFSFAENVCWSCWCCCCCYFARCHFSSASVSLHSRLKRQASERMLAFVVYVMQLLHLYTQHSNECYFAASQLLQ